MKRNLSRIGAGAAFAAGFLAIALAVGSAPLFYAKADSETTETTETTETLTISDPFEGFETRYEAEYAEVAHAAIQNYGNSHSGTGFVGEIDYSDSAVTFTVTAEEEGEYDMLLAYAIGEGFQPGTLRIYNDDVYYVQVNCRLTLGWGVFSRDAVAQCKISLRAGENKVSVRKGNNNVQLDFICIGARTGDFSDGGTETTAPAVPEGYTRYEAEDGFVVNANAKGRNFAVEYGSYYSGGGFVGNLDSVNHYVDIPVTVAESGTYEINIRYATGSSLTPSFKICAGVYGVNKYLFSYRTVQLSVRNGWGEFSDEGVASTRIALKAGESFVRVLPSFDYAELDCIEIGGRVGDYYEGIDELATGSGGSGDNEFDDGFFSEDEGDGYEKISGCNASVSYTAPAVLTAAVVIMGILLIRRNKNEKVR